MERRVKIDIIREKAEEIRLTKNRDPQQLINCKYRKKKLKCGFIKNYFER